MELLNVDNLFKAIMLVFTTITGVLTRRDAKRNNKANIDLLTNTQHETQLRSDLAQLSQMLANERIENDKLKAKVERLEAVKEDAGLIEQELALATIKYKTALVMLSKDVGADKIKEIEDQIEQITRGTIQVARFRAYQQNRLQNYPSNVTSLTTTQPAITTTTTTVSNNSSAQGD